MSCGLRAPGVAENFGGALLVVPGVFEREPHIGLLDIAHLAADGDLENVVWEGQPLTAQEIVTALASQSDWAAPTIKTMLHRLVKKQVLTYEAQGNRYVYRSAVRRSDCIRQASRSFLHRVFEGEPGPLVAHFLRNTKLSAAEIAELRTILDEQEAQS